MTRVLVLGAGFSRAISRLSPLTDELGDLVLRGLPDERLPERPRTFGYFEAWLSRLAEPQPDLTPAKNLANQSTYLDLVEAIHNELIAREQLILNTVPPGWLETFVRTAHENRTTICTFNYDLLVEHSIAAWVPPLWTAPHPEHYRASWAGATDFVPGNAPGFAWLTDEYVDTMRLLKMHGSINQYWVPGDRTGASIARWNFGGGWGSPEELDRRKLNQTLPGRSAFLIPPAAAKSSMYDNPITAQIWQSARAALCDATSVSLVGYSMPITDLVTSGMLAETLGREDVAITVVNPDPDPVIRSLATIGIHDPAVVDGDDAVERHIAQLAADDGRALVARLTTYQPVDPGIRCSPRRPWSTGRS